MTKVAKRVKALLNCKKWIQAQHIKTKKNLCVADWNVDRGYLTRGKKDELQCYISAQGIDICCTTPRSMSKIDENIDVNNIDGWSIKPLCCEKQS